MPRYEVKPLSSRQIKSFENKPQRIRQRNERDYPLLASQIPCENNWDVAQEQERRRQKISESEKVLRGLRAKHWRNARACYFSCPESMRMEIKARWVAWRWNRNPINFIYLVELYNGVSEAKRKDFQERKTRMALALYQAKQGCLALEAA